VASHGHWWASHGQQPAGHGQRLVTGSGWSRAPARLVTGIRQDDSLSLYIYGFFWVQLWAMGTL